MKNIPGDGVKTFFGVPGTYVNNFFRCPQGMCEKCFLGSFFETVFFANLITNTLTTKWWTFILKVRTKMSKQEMDAALDYLSSEGHIYSTIDEDHFKTTDE